MDKNMKRIGAYVRELRLVEGCSQAKLADRCGVSRKTINEIEGGRSNFEYSTLRDIAKALGCEVSVVFIVKGS